jgi:tetratricopeptide (TPR) repeat protein
MVAQLIFPLIDDPVRSVRIEVARVLASIPVGQLQGDLLEKYNRAMGEYIQSQLVNAERPEAQLNLGNYYANKGNLEKAEVAYQTAIKLEDVFVPAYINLADLYRAQHDDIEAEKILNAAIQVSPENADAHYALGLLMIRQQHSDKAIGYLHRASGFDLNNAHYVYVYAVALNSAGKSDLAIAVLQDANKRFPQDTNILEALIAFHRDAGNDFAAQTLIRKRQKLK